MGQDIGQILPAVSTDAETSPGKKDMWRPMAADCPIQHVCSVFSLCLLFANFKIETGQCHNSVCHKSQAHVVRVNCSDVA